MDNTVFRCGLDYAPCHYGTSRVAFRGPKPALTGGYVACLGGSETFGRFLARPFAAQLSDRLGRPCLNLGQINAGLDLYLGDAEVQRLADGAEAVVLQVVGAANLSNRYYRVHPRRNDRFLTASPELRALYPEVDFALISFVGALIAKLIETDAERFALVQAELQAVWSRRMARLIARIAAPVWLLWLSEAPPPERARPGMAGLCEPAFVTRSMLEALAPGVAGMIEVLEPAAAHDTAGMVFSAAEMPLARRSFSLGAHARSAQALAGAIDMAMAA
ncbi:DUF6473 family protein [Roseivivax sp. GX 12232]|nr:DUF6473 family protein [Roseivivax sp. GX 12232]MCE0507028.1 DUF6473 family protein [Roseivivax sp. GX 12232]